MTRLISFAVLIAIIVFIGLLFYKVLIGFFVPVFLAAVLVVVFRPLHEWVLNKTNQRRQLAALLTTVLMMLCLFLPVSVVAVSAAVQGLRLIEQNDTSTVRLRINKVRDSLGLELPAFYESLEQAEIEVVEIVKETSDSSGDEQKEKIEQLGRRAIGTFVRLKAAVEQVEGPKWDGDFERLINLAADAGHPVEQEGEPQVRLNPAGWAVDLKTEFSKLKTSLMGGSFTAVARAYANPSGADIDRFTRNAIEYVRPKLLSITGATGSFIVRMIFGAVILVVATFFFLYDGPGMIKTIMNLSPLDDEYEQELLLEFDRISRAVVLATILSAIVQGITAGIGYAIAGMDVLVLLVMLTTVFAMVPFVGPAVVWVPVCLYLALYEERYWAAGLLAVWGVLVVGTIDNLVKAFVLHGQSQLHPLLALLSVLGGVQTLGPIGIVVGPMVVTMLQTLLSILQRELVHFEKHGLSFSKNEQTENPSGDPSSGEASTAQHANSVTTKTLDSAAVTDAPGLDAADGAAS